MDLDALLDNALELSVLGKTYKRLTIPENSRPVFEYKDSYGTYHLKFARGAWGIQRRGLLHPTYIWHPNEGVWKDRDQRNHSATLNLCVSKSLDVAKEAMEYRAQTLYKIFEKKPHPDLSIKLKDGSLVMAHKNIVSAVVPSWECMLSSDMSEARTNIIELIDVEPEVAKAFVNAIYCGTVENRQHLCGVAVLADRYQAKALFKQVMMHVNKLMKVGATDYQNVQNMVKLLPVSEELETLIITMHDLVKNSTHQSFCKMMGFQQMNSTENVETKLEDAVVEENSSNF